MKLRSRKLKACSGDNDNVCRDRLAEMPDEVIVHILSYLPIIDAVRTILLRRFGDLWTLIPNLNFDIDLGRFYKFVRKVLMLYKTPSIDKFQLCLTYQGYEDMMDAEADDDIRKSIRFALDRPAKEIVFRYTSPCDFYWNDFLPKFTSQYLVRLELVGCRLDPPFHIKLGSLKNLLLDDVVICEESFRQIESGCPSLQEVRIVSPFELVKLGFSAPNINRLSLVITKEFPSCLYVPNLKSLELVLGEIPLVIGGSSVRSIYLGGFTCAMDKEYDRWLFDTCCTNFGGAEGFFLSNNAELFLHSLEDFEDLQIRWKHVVMEVPKFCESCLVGISELLRGLEQLEELIIYTSLTGAEELKFVKCVSTFRRASTNASVVFA